VTVSRMDAATRSERRWRLIAGPNETVTWLARDLPALPGTMYSYHTPLLNTNSGDRRAGFADTRDREAGGVRRGR
jgi:hypothetical protein